MPIQIGKYRSVSFSFRITTCCPLGMCTRMESTCISTNLAILNSSLSYHRVFQSPTGFSGIPARLNSDGAGAPKEAAARPDRRPLAGLSSLLCVAVPDRPGRKYRQRRLWFYVDALAGAARASGLRARLVRPGRPDVPARGARPVQGDPPPDASRIKPAVSADA